MLSTTSIHTSIVKNQSFLNYISEFDHRHSVPGINKASEEILELFQKGRDILKLILGNLSSNNTSLKQNCSAT